MNNTRRGERGSVRTVLLVLVSFFLGVAVTAFWFHRPAGGNATNAVSQTAVPPTGVGQAAAPSSDAAASSEASTAAASSGAPSSTTSASGTPSSAASAPSASAAAILASADAAAVEAVKKQIPDYAAISLEEGENILRAAALKESEAAAAQMDAQIKAAQQQLQDAQNGQSVADQQAAMKNVQDTQLAAVEKLKDIAANLQAQIAALKNLKTQP